jgi:hypothetical protein
VFGSTQAGEVVRVEAGILSQIPYVPLPPVSHGTSTCVPQSHSTLQVSGAHSNRSFPALLSPKQAISGVLCPYKPRGAVSIGSVPCCPGGSSQHPCLAVFVSKIAWFLEACLKVWCHLKRMSDLLVIGGLGTWGLLYFKWDMVLGHVFSSAVTSKKL